MSANAELQAERRAELREQNLKLIEKYKQEITEVLTTARNNLAKNPMDEYVDVKLPNNSREFKEALEVAAKRREWGLYVEGSLLPTKQARVWVKDPYNYGQRVPPCRYDARKFCLPECGGYCCEDEVVPVWTDFIRE